MKYKDGLRKIQEMNVAGGPGGMFGYGGGGADIGMHGGDVGNSDWYAPGDTRIPGILGASKKRGKKGKKKSKMPVYRRSFIESLALESAAEDELNLSCVVYTEHVEYQQIISDILKNSNIPFVVEENSFIIEGTDLYLNSILNLIQETITAEPFECEEVIALIGEMTLNPNDWKGVAAYKTALDYYRKFDPDKHTTIEEFTDKFLKQLEKGIKVEMEHTDDPEIAEKIARDHLWEMLDYYDRLAKMENKRS